MAGGLLLSQVVGKPLTGPGGDTVGRAADLVVRLTQGALPSVTGIVLRVGGRDTFVPQADVSELSAGGVRLAVDRVGTRAFERRAGEVSLVR
ncbi:MAG: magnesium transporter MgtE, partial [Chloroflexota bacterium]|nr:magnesium transporter MgtE [Chloroflexota bacterium]